MSNSYRVPKSATECKTAKDFINYGFAQAGRGLDHKVIQRCVRELAFTKNDPDVLSRAFHACRYAGVRAERKADCIEIPPCGKLRGLTDEVDQKIEVTMQAIVSQKRQLMPLEDQYTDLLEERTQILNRVASKILGVPADRLNASSQNWECDSSPSGFCIYNDEEDQMWDNCCFCHMPDERK